MKKTTDAIIARLPDKELLSPLELAAAFGLKTSQPILNQIDLGKLSASKLEKGLSISRDVAIEFIQSCETSL